MPGHSTERRLVDEGRHPVRVVRSLETVKIKRQLDKQVHEQTAGWVETMCRDALAKYAAQAELKGESR